MAPPATSECMEHLRNEHRGIGARHLVAAQRTFTNPNALYSLPTYTVLWVSARAQSKPCTSCTVHLNFCPRLLVLVLLFTVLYRRALPLSELAHSSLPCKLSICEIRILILLVLGVLFRRTSPPITNLVVIIGGHRLRGPPPTPGKLL